MRTTETGGIYLDGIDKDILNHLMSNALEPVTALAKKIGISNTAVHQRIKKMQESGLIRETIAIVDYQKMGYRTNAYIGVYMDKSSQYKMVIKELQKIPEVLEAHFTTGNYGIFIKILAKDNLCLMHLLNDQIQKIKGVVRTETFLSLDQPIERQIKV